MNDQSVRWGILGAAEIARKNWKGIRNAGGVVVAVASRDRPRCGAFVSECQAEAPFPTRPEVVGSYAELLERKDIEAVYIPLPTGLRKEWVIRAAEAGKHVVCEKPCARTLPDLEEMLSVCRSRGVQFMDGVMFAHSQRLDQVREALRANAVGGIKRITSAFSFYGDASWLAANIRTDAELEPHGCVGDLGWYSIHWALWAMDWELPVRVGGRTLSEVRRPDSSAAVPTEFSGDLLFGSGVSASFYCSFITGLQQWALVSGTEGYLELSDFVLPFFGSELEFKTRRAEFEIRGCDFRMRPGMRQHVVAEYSDGHRTSQETNLFRAFGEQIRSGSLDLRWPEMARKTQWVMAGCLESARADGRLIALAGAS